MGTCCMFSYITCSSASLDTVEAVPSICRVVTWVSVISAAPWAMLFTRCSSSLALRTVSLRTMNTVLASAWTTLGETPPPSVME